MRNEILVVGIVAIILAVLVARTMTTGDEADGGDGWFNTSIETGIKLRILPIYTIYVFMDIDVEILGFKRPDIVNLEWPIFGSPQALSWENYSEGVEAGYTGINAFCIPDKSLENGVKVENLSTEEWSYIGSANIFVVRDPQTPYAMELLPPTVQIGPVVDVSEKTGEEEMVESRNARELITTVEDVEIKIVTPDLLTMSIEDWYRIPNKLDVYARMTL
jgi:hypothetical protein